MAYNTERRRGNGRVDRRGYGNGGGRDKSNSRQPLPPSGRRGGGCGGCGVIGLTLTGLLVGGAMILGGKQAEAKASEITAFLGQNPQARAAVLVDRRIQPEVKADNVVNWGKTDRCTGNMNIADNVRQWCHLIDRYSDMVGLPPGLIAALITQESAGKPDAYSHSGAVGLMQIMSKDGTAAKFQCKNGPCFHDRPTMAQLYDPEFNIQWGTSFLADLLERHGNIRDALKAYGPMDRGYEYADKVLSIYDRY